VDRHRDVRTPAPRVLLVPNTIAFPPYVDELPELHRAGSAPRAWINEVRGDIHCLDQRLQTNPPWWRKRVYRHLPMWVVQVMETHRVGRDYDVVLCWSVADVTLVLGALLTVTRRHLPVVALLTRVSEPKKAWLLKRVHRRITKIILPPVTQREFAVDVLGVPEDKLVDLPWTLDSDFWRMPDPAPEVTTICAAGGEMRDYDTLVQAMVGLDIPCHIAGSLDADRPDWWNATDEERSGDRRLPPNVTTGTMSAVELRQLYARSRFVVVPLRPTLSDNGITCMNEAWAMGRPVIVSVVDGQRDAFVHGVEGLWVPQGDAHALRDAIIELWGDPARAEAMGTAGRRRIERGRDHRVFSDGVSRVLDEVAASSRRHHARRHR
jgi:glycosyltransferase involved in cell wall biosynthesis